LIAPTCRGATLLLSAFIIALSVSPASGRDAEGEPASSGPRPAPPYGWTISMWAGAGGADSSDATVRQAGNPLAGSATGFGAFLTLGLRAELYPDLAGRVAEHFGFALEIAGLAGEADIATTPGFPPEQVSIVSGIITPSLVVRFPGRTWEGYAGAGLTLLMGTRLSGIGGGLHEGDDTDMEAPLGLSVYGGARRSYPAGWFFQIEARYQAGHNDFDLSVPLTRIELDLKTTQFVIGTGYRL